MPLRYSAFAALFPSVSPTAGETDADMSQACVQPCGVGARQALITILDRLDAQRVERVSPMIARQRLAGDPSTFTLWRFKAGAASTPRRNPSELIHWVTQGRAEVQVDGHALIMGPGDVMIIPPYAPHALVFVEDAVLVTISTFEPSRGDHRPGRLFQDIARRAVPLPGRSG